MTYEYKDPLANGYSRFYLTSAEHNALFPHRQKRWFERYEYYISSEAILLQRFSGYLAIAINLVMLPVSFIWHGLSNWAEVWRDHKKMFNEKKHGSFSEDKNFSTSETYKRVDEYLGQR